MADLVKMRREDGTEADVHTSMVDDYRLGGFVVVEDAKKPAAKKPRKAKGD